VWRGWLTWALPPMQRAARQKKKAKNSRNKRELY
jgi:hypothetical protein